MAKIKLFIRLALATLCFFALLPILVLVVVLAKWLNDEPKEQQL